MPQTPSPFSQEHANRFGATYQSSEVRPMRSGGCMHAAYAGLGELYGADYAVSLRKRVYRTSAAKERRANASRAARGLGKVVEGAFNTIDLVFGMLEEDGNAAAPIIFTHAGTGWRPAVESHLVNLIDRSVPAWYFFGLSVSEGYHSVIIAVDATADVPRVFWMDQFSEGFGRRSSNFATASTEVTGTLNVALEAIGTHETRAWAFRIKTP